MNLSVLIVFLPLFSAAFCYFLKHKLNNKQVEVITTSMLGMSAFLSIIIFYKVVFLGQIQHIILCDFIKILDVKWEIYIDNLTATMLVVVTGISSLVHLYSIGYMHEDDNIKRFMIYLSLFTFLMIILVVANNLVQLFVGWEGVGLCSYLLIGYYYKKESACSASMKAFIVNRVGDFFFLIAIFAIYKTFGTLEITKINIHNIPLFISIFNYNFPALEFIAISLFIGCMGKSAQIGLHIWLPDAMEGPTPVSALIHAATMVTAGIFLVAKFSFLFEHAPLALNLMTGIGAITCISAAGVAIVQTDIKKIIAYSTCSQLGYMFFACGVSAYHAAIFHLATHAYFKALLFLSAGSVIHGAHHEQDITKLGGLKKLMPYTYIAFLIGSLAIAGIFPFAGFYSKDLILEYAYISKLQNGNFAFICGMIVVFLTAFYSWRLLILVFSGEKKQDAHESPTVMLVPLGILSIMAVFAGLIGDKILHLTHTENYLNISQAIKGDVHHIDLKVKYLPLFLSLAGILSAYIVYGLKLHDKFSVKLIHKILWNKYYIDELYNLIFVRPFKMLGQAYKFIDNYIIDRLGPGLVSLQVKEFSTVVCYTQTGYIFHYSLYFIFAMLGIIGFLWYLY